MQPDPPSAFFRYVSPDALIGSIIEQIARKWIGLVYDISSDIKNNKIILIKIEKKNLECPYKAVTVCHVSLNL